jgi:hypothetical protein
VAIRTPDSPRLPQPGWRLTGFASIGLGAGLFTADAPFVLLAAAFLPALISMIIIAAHETMAPSAMEPARLYRIEVSDDDGSRSPARPEIVGRIHR